MSANDKCEECINAIVKLSENGYSFSCYLTQHKATECLCGRKSYFMKFPFQKEESGDVSFQESIKHFQSQQKRYKREHNGRECPHYKNAMLALHKVLNDEFDKGVHIGNSTSVVPSSNAYMPQLTGSAAKSLLHSFSISGDVKYSKEKERQAMDKLEALLSEKYIHGVLVSSSMANQTIKKDDEWRNETCWDNDYKNK